MRRHPRRLGAFADFQGVRIVYEGRVTGGELRSETHGSTGPAVWHSLDVVPGLDRVTLVDRGLGRWRSRRALGHVLQRGSTTT
ncbi:hypothetical protein [Streptomyces sp. ISL-10]|uniref:hypothetical protein n=1 Tax=Streptomyces sp. ISL-10 TaxID=2819172 RepID=UPI0027E59749|nr:hypothetical protein [Streptomyces sp. ISL-10]